MTRGLERALTRSAALAGAELAIERHRMTPWHSATFSGARHDILASAMSGDRLDQWLAQLSAPTTRRDANKPNRRCPASSGAKTLSTRSKALMCCSS